MAKRTVGCFSEEQLKEFAAQPNVTVMQPTHDIVFRPFETEQVSKMVDRLEAITKSKKTLSAIEDAVQADPNLKAFSEKYTVMYKKMTDSQFVADRENVLLLKRLIEERARVERGETDETQAKANAADIALKSFVSRIEAKKSET